MIPKMNALVKHKWIHALRSGEYKQGRKILKCERNGGLEYCCLGVLSDLHAKETGNGAWYPDHKPFETQFAYFAEGTDGACTPPDAVVRWAGLDSNTSNDSTIGNLVRLNDDSRSSFSEIADWIEDNL